MNASKTWSQFANVKPVKMSVRSRKFDRQFWFAPNLAREHFEAEKHVISVPVPNPSDSNPFFIMPYLLGRMLSLDENSYDRCFSSEFFLLIWPQL